MEAKSFDIQLTDIVYDLLPGETDVSYLPKELTITVTSTFDDLYTDIIEAVFTSVGHRASKFDYKILSTVSW